MQGTTRGSVPANQDEKKEFNVQVEKMSSTPEKRQENVGSGPLYVGERNLLLWQYQASTQQIELHSLEELRDWLIRLEERQIPYDETMSLENLHVSFEKGHMSAQVMSADSGLKDRNLLFLETGALNVAREVLPARFFSGLQDLVMLDTAGAKLATMVWSKFRLHMTSRPRKVRTIMIRDPHGSDKPQRAIRSCHSTDYASFSNKEFVQDLLNNAERYASMPILGARVTDTGMRIRFAGTEFNPKDPDIERPVSMIECWNSEVGRRKVGVRGGAYHLRSGHALTHWNRRKEYSWVHRGSTKRIKDEVNSSFADLVRTASEVLEAYESASSILVEDPREWVGSVLGRFTTEKEVEHVQARLENKPCSLAMVVDAIAIRALFSPGIFDQSEMEAIAAQVLILGLEVGRKSGVIHSAKTE